MFDIGWPEMLVVMVVALIVIGPSEIPGLFRQAGQWVARARRLSSELQRQFSDAIRDSELDALRQEATKMAPGNLSREIGKFVDPEGELQAMSREAVLPELSSSPLAPEVPEIPAAPGLTTGHGPARPEKETGNRTGEPRTGKGRDDEGPAGEPDSDARPQT